VCDVINVVAEFMVRSSHQGSARLWQTLDGPSVLRDVISVVAEFMVRRSSSGPMERPFRVWTQFTASTGKRMNTREASERNVVGRTHGSASHGAKAWEPMCEVHMSVNSVDKWFICLWQSLW
jgi:hypothetical protein